MGQKGTLHSEENAYLFLSTVTHTQVSPPPPPVALCSLTTWTELQAWGPPSLPGETWCDQSEC